MMSLMISLQVRMIWTVSDAELTVFSHTVFCIHVIINLPCNDDI